MTTTYTYMPGGAAGTTATAAGTTTDAYNAAGEVESVSHSTPASGYTSASTVSYTYEPAGEVETMTDGTGETTYGYDYAGDLTSAAFVAASGSGLDSATTSCPADITSDVPRHVTCPGQRPAARQVGYLSP